jgi:hypothetical protein
MCRVRSVVCGRCVVSGAPRRMAARNTGTAERIVRMREKARRYRGGC